MQTISVDLPEEVYARLQGMADATRQPLTSVIFQSIRGNLPPVLDDLPPEQRALAADLQERTDEALWAVARTRVPADRWRRHQQLLRKGEAGALRTAEQEELAQLREATDRAVLRRSYALALLKWRGHTIVAVP